MEEGACHGGEVVVVGGQGACRGGGRVEGVAGVYMHFVWERRLAIVHCRYFLCSVWKEDM